MFNLLVSGNGEWWEDKPFLMHVDRFKEYSGAEGDTIALDQPDTLRLLEDVPTLLMYEVGARGPNARLAGAALSPVAQLESALAALRRLPQGRFDFGFGYHGALLAGGFAGGSPAVTSLWKSLRLRRAHHQDPAESHAFLGVSMIFDDVRVCLHVS